MFFLDLLQYLRFWRWPEEFCRFGCLRFTYISCKYCPQNCQVSNSIQEQYAEEARKRIGTLDHPWVSWVPDPLDWSISVGRLLGCPLDTPYLCASETGDGSDESQNSEANNTNCDQNVQLGASCSPHLKKGKTQTHPDCPRATASSGCQLMVCKSRICSSTS